MLEVFEGSVFGRYLHIRYSIIIRTLYFTIVLAFLLMTSANPASTNQSRRQ